MYRQPVEGRARRSVTGRMVRDVPPLDLESEAQQSWAAAMRRGDYSTAWSISDAVLAARDPHASDEPNLPYHRRWVWDGTAPAGKDVLVRCYHGLGDTIQFARFLPALVGRNKAVTVEVQPELLPLLSGSLPTVTFVPFRPEQPRPAMECNVEIMELSHALRLPPSAAPPPYLAVPKERVSKERARLAGPEPLVALCWRSGDWDLERSLSLAPLLASLPPHWRRVSLQRDIREDERRCFFNAGDSLATIVDTAAIIAAADVIISVDTMVAHLTGALGRPALVLLKWNADWRWDVGRASRWYPATRLFRQSRPGDWDSALCALHDAFVGGRPRTLGRRLGLRGQRSDHIEQQSLAKPNRNGNASRTLHVSRRRTEPD